jgi:hypothetical protein
MNRNEFNRFIVGIGLPGPADIEGLRELTTLFPWFHSAHLLLLKGLKENSDIRFDSQLKASALSVSDREVLYHYIYLSPGGETAAEVTDKVSVATETVEQPAAEAVVEEPAEEMTEAEAEAVHDADATVTEEEASLATETVEQPAADAVVEESVVESTAEVPAEEVTEMEAVSEAVQDTDAEVPEEEAVSELIEEAVTEEPPHTEEVTDHEPAAEVIPEPEVAPEEEVVPEAVAAAGLNTGLRSREELVAEIEARLRELEIITREQISKVEAEYSAGEADTVPLTAGEAEALVASEVDTVPIPADEPETIFTGVDGEAPLPADEPVIGARGVEDAEEDLQPAAEAETEYETVTGPVRDELLELLPDDTFTEKEPEKETLKELTPADLIDRFISISPTIERIKPGEVLPVRDLSETGNEEEASFITETLAKIYIN